MCVVPPSLPEADASDASVRGGASVNGLAMESRRFRHFYSDAPKRCQRCERTLAKCGDDHWVGMYSVETRQIEWSRICCFCVLELNALGADGVLVATDAISICPVRTRQWLN